MIATDFWQDTPWLNIPAHRAALIVEHPSSRGRLLGGGPKAKEGKVSKLAALAAKRRQAEAAKSSEDSVIAGSATSDDYTETLNQLRISQSRKSVSTETDQQDELAELADDVNMSDANKEAQENPPRKEEEVFQDLRGTPSPFAKTLAGIGPPTGVNNLTVDQLGLSVPTFKFAEPSPDDVIAKAQKTRK
jgi:elongation factor 1 alpha-like protein